jgi:cytochrome c-type biogenesis protein CcmH
MSEGMIMHGSQVYIRRLLTCGRWRWFLLALLVWSLVAPTAFAQDGPTQDDVNAVARKLFCPVCENTPLDVCPTQACQNWRDEIRVALADGKSEQEILDDFAHKYGDSVLAQPPARQWVAWVLPIVILAAAVLALAYWLRSWTRPAPVRVATDQTTDDLGIAQDDPYLQKLERELSEWEA